MDNKSKIKASAFTEQSSYVALDKGTKCVVFMEKRIDVFKRTLNKLQN